MAEATDLNPVQYEFESRWEYYRLGDYHSYQTNNYFGFISKNYEFRNAHVAQLAEATDSKPVQYEFESHGGYKCRFDSDYGTKIT